MKINIYSKSVIVFLLVVMLATLTFANDYEFATNEQKNDLYYSVDNYYFTFEIKNMEDYLNTQYLNHLSSEELIAKENLIQEMWDKYTSVYSLIEKDDFIYFIDDRMAFVEYTLSIDNDDNELNSFDIEMTAILFDTEAGWKIFNTVPTSLFEFNTAVDLFGNKDTLVSDNVIQENFSRVAVNISRNPKLIICDIDIDLTLDEPYLLDDLSLIDKVIGDNKNIKVNIGDSFEMHYKFKDNYLTSILESDDIDYLVILDTCTLQRLVQGANPQLEYENGNIKVKGGKIGSKFKMTFGKMFFKIYSWFDSDQPLELWIEAETGELESNGGVFFCWTNFKGPW